jgi:trans-aconitate methyltransferase
LGWNPDRYLMFAAPRRRPAMRDDGRTLFPVRRLFMAAVAK